jgi:hypothetical protein
MFATYLLHLLRNCFFNLTPFTMRDLIIGFLVLIMLSLSSCTKVVYTNQEVLGRYKTKQEVTQKFGVPAEKLIGSTREEWFYRFESKFPMKHLEMESLDTTSTVVTQFKRNGKYVLFTFDKQGNVLSSEFKNIDVAERKLATGRTIALLGGIAVILFAQSKIQISTFNGFGY